MRLICRPIDSWPGRLLLVGEREWPLFKAAWSDTVDVLAREVEMLTPRRIEAEVVLQLAVGEQELRLDGWIRANARPAHPGVIVSFESVHGPLRYHTDRFGSKAGMAGWQANVRAIALGLEALRKVDRYGIASDGEQYRGWAQLPAGPATDGPMTVEEAAAFIATHADVVSPEGLSGQLLRGHGLADAYRAAAKRLHPDHGGDPALFRRLGEARDLLDRTVGEADRA